jgi:hypothetical protein
MLLHAGLQIFVYKVDYIYDIQKKKIRVVCISVIYV